MTAVVGFLMELFRIFLTLTRPYSDKVMDVIYGLIFVRAKPLPPIEDKIILFSATKLSAKIRKRKIKAETVMTAYIERIKVVQPRINACTDFRFDDALKEARAVDIFLENSNLSEEELLRETPLLGVPFTCKESIGVKGLLMTQGIVAHKNRRAPMDAESTALYRKAGAIPVTVTNVPFRAMWWESANQVFGMTKNPYDPSRTAGGSTGGEGALITAGGALIGIGSDLAGSIRIPSSFCGIYGHKPSTGIISNNNPLPAPPGGVNLSFQQYLNPGPMCRFVEDLSVLTQVLAGHSDKIDWQKKVDFQAVRIYYIEEFPGFLLRASEDVKTAVRKAARHFEDSFDVSATKLSIEELRDAFTIWECKILETGVPSFRDLISLDDGDFDHRKEWLKSLVQRSNYTWPALFYAAVERRVKDKTYYECLHKFEVLKKKLDCILKEDAILLVPTHPEPPPHHLLTIPKYPNIAYTCIFNVLGYPCTQVPAGFSGGLPIGLQVVSSTNSDPLTIAAAVELDKLFGGWVSPCPVVG